MPPLVREDRKRVVLASVFGREKPERNKSEIYSYKYNGNLYEWLYVC
mgnify:CR=1 FL=1